MEPLLDLTKECGLVLDGGGARGAYQIGAWTALEEAGVKVCAGNYTLKREETQYAENEQKEEV